MEKKTVSRVSTPWEERIDSFFDTPKPKYLLSTLRTIYFPPDDVSIFSQLPDLCKKFSKQGVISKELRSGQLSKIQQQLKDYLDGDSKKRQTSMDYLVDYCEKYKMNVIKSRDSVQLLPIVITFSLLHLTVLLERSINQTQIYGGWNNSRDRELREKIADYRTYFVDAYQLWQDWRKDQITIKTGYDPKKKETIIGTVTDTIDGRSANYSSPKVIQRDDGTPENVNPNKFKDVCLKIKNRFYNDVDLEFMRVLYVHTFALNKFEHDKWHELPVAPSSKVATVWYGTYGRDTYPDGKHNTEDCGEEYELTNETGVIKGININEYNTVNALTFLWHDQDPKDMKKVGNIKAGHLTTVRGLNGENNYITAVDLYFNHNVICAIQFFFSNGMQTEVLGNRTKADAVKISCRPGKNNEFKLTGVKMASSMTDKKEDESVGYIALGFEYARVMKDEKKK